jgi:hypothetical protein
MPSTIAGMTGGVYYCMVAEAGATTTAYSSEFMLYVEAPLAAQMLQPPNNSQINNMDPNFLWQAVSGVPYYTLMLSDSPISIQAPSSGSANYVTINADPIWLVTTNQLSMQYPNADPSQYYNELLPPPLMQGLTYSWAVLNNYTGTPSLISGAFAGAFQFSVNLTAACTAPVLTSPMDGSTIQASTQPLVNLSWDTVPNANSYEVFVASNETNSQEVGGLSRVPRWNITVPSSVSYTTIPADVGLNDRWYSWYVVALDSQGMGAKSQTQSFYYNVSVTSVELTVETTNVLPNALTTIPEAIVKIQSLSGANVNIYPMITDNSGYISYDLPPGNYQCTISKPGYEPYTFSGAITLVPFGIMNLGAVYLTPCAYTLTGYVYDNSSPNQPLSGVQVTASQAGTSFQGTTASDGSFAISISGAGQWNILATKSGYTQAGATTNVPVGSFTYAMNTPASPIILVKNQDTLFVSVKNPSGQGINNAQVSVYLITNPSISYTLYTVNGSCTMYLSDGTWVVNVADAGFLSPGPVNVPLAGGSSGAANFIMQLAANQISGNVTYNGMAMQGVVVNAISVTGTVIPALTNAYGNYSMSVGSGYYVVNATDPGYTSIPQGITFSGATGGQQQTGVNFALALNNSPVYATLYVLVSGTASSLLQNANVSLQGNDPVTTGYTATGVTDANGGVTITASSSSLPLPAGSYNISLADFGYLPINTTITLAGGANSAGYVMSVDNSVPGTISGSVTNNGNPVAGVLINICLQSASSVPVYTTYTAASGNYSVSALEGSYYVIPAINNYVINPSSQISASLTPGGTATASFTLTQPQGGGSITVSAPAGPIYNQVPSGPNTYNFTATYKDGNGNEVPVAFAWSVVPAAAGTISQNPNDQNVGVFTPTMDYIGQVTVKATALGQTSISQPVPVWQELTSSWPKTNKTVQDYQGFSLQITAGSWTSSQDPIDGITVNEEVPSSQRAMTKNGMVIGSIYDLISSGITFSPATPMDMTLPLPSNYNTSSAQIAAWNTTNLNWQDVSGSSIANNGVSAGVSTLCEYAVIIPLQPLGFASVTMLPNPFSPYRGGLNINYILESREGSQVLTTIKIYNMAGRLIRSLLDRQEKGVGIINTQVWDGKDKDGQIGANGRYILQIEIEDASGKKQGLYSIVLIK